MPELPEVNAFEAYIKKHCLHKIIGDVHAAVPGLIKNVSYPVFKKELIGDQFESVERSGKYLVINLKKSSKKIIMHFGLTGFLTYKKNHEKVRFSCITFMFKDHSELHFNSVRKFEKIWLIGDISQIQGLKNLGYDPLEITYKIFLELIEKYKHKNIKSFFMDQKVIAGIGNEYSDEILFQAGIDPRRKIDTLSKIEQKKLFEKMKSVLRYSIRLRLKHLEQSVGEFFTKNDRQHFRSSYLQAHRHGDNKCPYNKDHALKQVKIGGRTTYFCPIDQQ